MNKLPMMPLEEAVETFRLFYQSILTDPDTRRFSFGNINKLDEQRELLIVIAVDANVGHGVVALEAMKNADNLLENKSNEQH